MSGNDRFAQSPHERESLFFLEGDPLHLIGRYFLRCAPLLDRHLGGRDGFDFALNPCIASLDKVIVAQGIECDQSKAKK